MSQYDIKKVRNNYRSSPGDLTIFGVKGVLLSATVVQPVNPVCIYFLFGIVVVMAAVVEVVGSPRGCNRTCLWVGEGVLVWCRDPKSRRIKEMQPC